MKQEKAMQYYEIATLTVGLGTGGRAGEAAASFAASGGGRLLGIFVTEIGRLNRMVVLRGFATLEDLIGERQRTLQSVDPFGCGSVVAAMEIDSYAPFPFMPPVEAGRRGPVYEFRTCHFRPGGLPATIAQWRAALPARERLSPCLIAMHTIHGAPRFTQVWPYPDLAARGRARAGAVAAGVWPPGGAAARLTLETQSTIALPHPLSPLQ
jgi:hypothetical protein